MLTILLNTFNFLKLFHLFILGVIVVVAVDVIVLAPAQADAAVVAPHLAPDQDPGETAGAGLLPDPGTTLSFLVA